MYIIIYNIIHVTSLVYLWGERGGIPIEKV